LDNGNEVNFTGYLAQNGIISKEVDGNKVQNWPLGKDLAKVPQPFILQHALKYLLVAKPDERFKGFAHLLGLEALDNFQKNIQSLCTKPDACLPDEATQLLTKVSSIETSLAIKLSFLVLASRYLIMTLENVHFAKNPLIVFLINT
jgi:hypothetical protein